MTKAKGLVRRGLLVAVAMLALIGAGCSEGSGDGGAGAETVAGSQAVKFAECMRDNGVNEFPDPDASGELTIDGVVNGSSIDTEGPAWQSAITACKDLQPPGFTGDEDITAEQQEARLEFAQCIRENGVADFPDPAEGEPLVNTNVIPSAATDEGMTILNAAMETCGDLAEEAIGQ